MLFSCLFSISYISILFTTMLFYTVHTILWLKTFSAILIFVFQFVFWEKRNSFPKTSYEVIYANQDSIFYKTIHVMKHLLNADQSHIFPFERPPTPSDIFWSSRSSSYVFDIIRMLDYTKMIHISADMTGNASLFCFSYKLCSDWCF